MNETQTHLRSNTVPQRKRGALFLWEHFDLGLFALIKRVDLQAYPNSVIKHPNGSSVFGLVAF